MITINHLPVEILEMLVGYEDIQRQDVLYWTLVCKRFQEVFHGVIYDKTLVKVGMMSKGKEFIHAMSPRGLHKAMDLSPTIRSLVWRIAEVAVVSEPATRHLGDELSKEQLECVLSQLAPTTLRFRGELYPELWPGHVSWQPHTELWLLVERCLSVARLECLEYKELHSYHWDYHSLPLLCMTHSRNTLTSLSLPKACQEASVILPHFPHLTDVRGLALIVPEFLGCEGNYDFAFALFRQAPKLRKISLKLRINIGTSRIIAGQLAELCGIVGTPLCELEVEYDYKYGDTNHPPAPPLYTPDFRRFTSVRMFSVDGESRLVGWDLALLPPHLERLVVVLNDDIDGIPLAAQFVEALGNDKWQEGLRALALDVYEGDTSPSEWAELQGLCERRDLEECDLVLHEYQGQDRLESNWPIPPGTHRYRRCGGWQLEMTSENEEEEEEEE